MSLVHKRPRVDPISCEQCRARKIKCNREQPCSSCAARGVACQSAIKDVSTAESQTMGVSNQFLARRVEKLEGIVMRLSEAAQTHSVPLTEQRAASVIDPTPRSEEEKAYEDDCLQLEESGMQEKSISFSLVEDVTFRIASHGLLNGDDSSFDSLVTSPSRVIWLPSKPDADVLVVQYTTYIDYLQHLVHVPTIGILLNNLYSKVDQGRKVEIGSAVLLLSICGVSLFNWIGRAENLPSHLTIQRARSVSDYWIRAAYDVLDYSRRVTRGSIEDLQALGILVFQLYQSEGITPRSFQYLSAAVTMARNLSLHKLDLCDTKRDKELLDQRIPNEIKRRVWWYIVSSDWALSLFGGPQEGTYLIHPRHMCVNLPRNINDSDLENPDPHFNRPLSEPTSMSYFIQRIRLAEISRSVVDVMPLMLSKSEVNYADIISLDAKFELVMHELPVFFRLDVDKHSFIKNIDQTLPHIALQRYIIAFTFHTRRCKLHQPFLVRGSLMTPYSYSRNVLLHSARAVIRAKRLMDRDKFPLALVHSKLLGVVYHVFMATVVLAMDFCYNRVEGEEEQRRGEVIDACRLLEGPGEGSSVTRKLLDTLVDVLKKHNVPLMGLERSKRTSDGADDSGTAGWHDQPSHLPIGTLAPATGSMESDFDVIWQNFMEPDYSFDNTGIFPAN